MVTRKIVGIVIISFIVIAAFAGVYEWHYRRYTWPADIQVGVLGTQIANDGKLLAWDGYSAYGEGVFHWRYRINERSEHLKKFCGDQSISHCAFTKTRRVNAGVTQTVQYSDGVLIVEEVWE